MSAITPTSGGGRTERARAIAPRAGVAVAVPRGSWRGARGRRRRRYISSSLSWWRWPQFPHTYGRAAAATGDVATAHIPLARHSPYATRTWRGAARCTCAHRQSHKTTGGTGVRVCIARYTMDEAFASHISLRRPPTTATIYFSPNSQIGLDSWIGVSRIGSGENRIPHEISQSYPRTHDTSGSRPRVGEDRPPSSQQQQQQQRVRGGAGTATLHLPPRAHALG